ncbi:DUF4402 domain-containing protein [Sphingomonas xanthus]|uniref:DUF4402 domain-containing protein n=1 Tax=Sphingomonas xanthus TaxID=2594473 RepID=A0A516IRW7_9SPHN|nr:DUF4402 domain-containing protein [Sphingomonas xanthus]QDP19564.1 DUF4402 domain-containing protein [Sphingomonas xanthus]
MTNFARFAVVAAATALFATPAAAAPVGASPKAKASARIVRPLTLTATRDLDFGTIVVGSIPGAQTVSVSQAGVLTCGTSGLTCSGTVSSAQYNVTGTNNMQVNITATASNLTNTTSGGSETLAFSPNAPASVTLTNSGAPGNNFTVGGSIVIGTATVDGLYSGDIEVTVDY